MNPRKTRRRLMVVLLVFIALSALSDQIMTGIGRGLIPNETPRAADAVVILRTGMTYFPRLYQAGMADRIVINDNCKSDALRQLEKLNRPT